MNIVSKGLVIAGLVVAVGFASVSQSFSFASLGCPMLNVEHRHEEHTSLNDCVTVWASNKSWFSWFSGKSRSAQYHFVDFVELVYQMHKVHEEFKKPSELK